MSNDPEKTQHSGRTGEFDISDMTDDEAEAARRRKRAKADADDSGWQDWGGGAWGKGKGGPSGGPNSWGADARWTGDKLPNAKPTTRSSRTEAIRLDDLHDTAAPTYLTDNRKYKVGGERSGHGHVSKWGSDAWDDNDASDGNSTLSINLDDIQAESSRLGNPILNKGTYSSTKDEDDSTYRAGHFKKLSNRPDDFEAPISKAPSRDGFGDAFGSDLDDDAGGWSPIGPRGASGGAAPSADSTAAIDTSAIAAADREAANKSGAAKAHLVIFAPDSPDSVLFEIRKPAIHIGRDFSNDVVLSDPYTSQKHVTIKRRGANFYEAINTSTANGTMINGHFISRARLQHGDHIEIGATILRFIPGVPSPQDRVPSSAPQRPPHYTAPPPGAAGGGPSTLMIVAVASLIMLLIAAGVVVIFFVVLD